MPVHVPPLSRRRFLATTLATTSGLILAQDSWAGARQTDHNRWILLADTHVCADPERSHSGERPVANFRRARGEFLAASADAAGLIIAGDCVFIEGLPEDYRSLASEVEPIRRAGIPLHFVLGNHDHRENLYDAFPDAKFGDTPVVDKHVALIETPHADWLLLDSLQRTNYTPGRLGEAQLQWLASRLDAKPEKPALIVFHHNPDATSATALEDTRSFLDMVAARKQVKAVLFGHTHRWSLAKHEGVHLVNLPTLVWVFDKTQSQGWVDAKLAAGGMSLRFNALNREHSSHGQRVELGWRT